MPGFHVEHFGCRAARADGEAVSERLRAAGHCIQQPAEADVVIVNTCSVTAEADRAARAFIRRAHRLNPAAQIVVTGCYAQRAPEELAAMAGVAAVVGNSHKALAPEIILGLAGGQGSSAGDDPEKHPSRAKALIDSVDVLWGLKPPPPSGSGLSVDGKIPTDPYRSLTEADLSPARELVSVQSLLTGGAQASAPIWADDRFAHSFLEEAQLAPGAQTRPNLKIQEGCGNRCTFCVIPQTRGSSKSLAGGRVLRQVEGFVAAGGNELVLSGINLGRWGRDLAGDRTDRGSRFPTLFAKNNGKDGAPSFYAESGQPLRLAGLVREIFEQTVLPRLRLSSIEPMDWDAELIGLMAEFGGAGDGTARLARHAHLPLQSGSDGVLQRMHRRYRPWHYVEKVEALRRAAGPELTLGADVMVGFPGETDAEFEETLAMVRALPFGYLHLFSFSPRPGTPGWTMHKERPVPAAAVEERMAALRALAAEKSKTHRMRFVGQELEAITLHTPADLAARGRTAALTENFLPVELEGRWEANRLVRVRATGLNAEGALEAAMAAPATFPPFHSFAGNIPMAV
jgi:threonylcarbamoyladenosine tRNA methylthiotransferase MtaB